jgi:hypothetical protein
LAPGCNFQKDFLLARLGQLRFLWPNRVSEHLRARPLKVHLDFWFFDISMAPPPPHSTFYSKRVPGRRNY